MLPCYGVMSTKRGDMPLCDPNGKKWKGSGSNIIKDTFLTLKMVEGNKVEG